MRVSSRAALCWLRTAVDSELVGSRALVQRRPQRDTCTSRLSCQIYSRLCYKRLYSTSSPQREDTRNVPQTHYDFFPTAIPTGPPPTGPFAVDLRALRREFLQLQAKAHPDLAPPERKRQAEALSSRINEAYKTLKNPLLRAQYILAERGIEVAEDAGAEAVGQDTLLEVLEAREEIEEAEKDDQVLALRKVNQGRIEASEEAIAAACSKQDWDGVRKESIKLRYWTNIREALDNWQPGKPVVVQH
ncbi:Co-chaperone Hsc20 [Pseudovirgaria hyperparasitica]|uniref:Co-chaperone Hsc20 n=1 Tax=Pseudovirgaria hyperparasitica TaxID=470096 RepID=A0A6A6W3K7_9PEZI|nr:Co-chaperone Hsc20 [Pseudovirgaria hyperparasitica]KAF2756729.1 Co-chaperone Hsc20 [Pseudovirgaria hyperparasitica]